MYDVAEMLVRYRGENDPSNDSRWNRPDTVEYLTAEERSLYVLNVKDGLLYDSSGNLFDTSDTRTEHGNQARAVFVMHRNGTIYASKGHEAGVFHHSSFLAGEPVASAGEMSVLNGEIVLISNRSGHYRPPPHIADQVVGELRQRGVNTTTVTLERM